MEYSNTELFSVLKTLLFDFDTICKRNNLTYSVFAGTLLGTIRHNGFIPWDDDIDVTMPRDDYNKLLALPVSEFKYPLFLQTPVTDKGYHKGFARIRNSNSTEISAIDAAFNCNHGVFIDVFPMDVVPDDARLFIKQIRKLKWQVKLLHFAGRFEGGVGDLGLSTIQKVGYHVLLPFYKTGLIKLNKLFLAYNQTASMYNDQSSHKVGTICSTFDNIRFIFDKKDYDAGYCQARFEDIIIQIPVQYDSILKNSYGNYMISVKEPTNHGTTIFFPDIPYNRYVHDHKDELVQLWLNNRKKYL